MFQPQVGWVAAPDPEPTAPSPPAPTAPAEPKANYGPKAPEPTPESLERMRLAQQERDLRLQEQEQQRHAAEANYGYPTSARPRPIEAPAAKKSSGVPPMSDLVALYNAASNESKSLAYDAVAKALPSPPEVKPALPVQAMPAVPQEIFMAEMASHVSSMLVAALGMPKPPPPKPATIVIYGPPEPKALPAPVGVPVPKAPAEVVPGDTTEEEEGEEQTQE